MRLFLLILHNGFFVVFATPFLGIGIWASLVGFGVIELDKDNIHAPLWVISVVGFIFFVGGMMILCMAWRTWRCQSRRSDAAGGIYAREMSDYDWNPEATTDARWGEAGKTLLGAIFVGVFLSVFNWWAWNDRSVFLIVFVGLFDLLLLFLCARTILLTLRALKFGASRVSWERFPVAPNDRGELELFWHVPAGISEVGCGRFTLRCVEEKQERNGESNSIRHDEVFHETIGFDDPCRCTAGDRVKLPFKLPDEARSSSIHAVPSYFYELEVNLTLPGVDFRERYLVPVYL